MRILLASIYVFIGSIALTGGLFSFLPTGFPDWAFVLLVLIGFVAISTSAIFLFNRRGNAYVFSPDEQRISNTKQFLRFINGLFFAVSCFASFIIFMFVNLYIVEGIVPGAASTVSNMSGPPKGVSPFAFLITCPIPLVFCYLWYKLFNHFDQLLLNANRKSA